MQRLVRDVSFGDLPCFGFGATQLDEFGHVGLSLGEEFLRSEFGIGIGCSALVTTCRTDIHAYLAFVGGGCRFACSNDDA